MKNKKSHTYRDLFKTLDLDIDYFVYKKIVDELSKSIYKHVIQQSEGFQMPYGLGYIQIVKYLPKNLNQDSLSIDYKYSKLYNKKIYHLNEHSNGYKFRLYWSKLPQTFPDRYKYQLCLVRLNKRKLAQLIFNNRDYINIDDIQLYKV